MSARPRRQRERLRVASRLQSDVKQLHDFVSFKASYLNLAVQYSQPQTQIPIIMLTGFVKANDNAIENANKSNSIKRGESPFQHGITFTVSGFTYEQAEIDGKVDKNAFLNPVLTTSVGSLFLSTVLRSRVTASDEVLTPSGSFNKFVREQISSHNSNGEILQAVVDGCKGKTIQVVRKPYAAITKDGRRYGASLIELNFME